jgi:hypothetical protein
VGGAHEIMALDQRGELLRLIQREE